MKKQIKMIGLDCDGTLLNNNKELTDYSKEVLLRALKQGIVVLAATGRPLSGIPRQVSALPGVRYALTSNGARIVDCQEEKVLYAAGLPLETAKKVLAVLKKYDAYKEIFLEGTGYCDREELLHIDEYAESAGVARYVRECRIPVESIEKLINREQKPLDKVSAIFRNLEDRQKAFAEIQQIAGTFPTGSMKNNLEVNAAGVNKGSGLLKLGEILGIRREEIMACGDGMNDLEMIREAGLGVAVENAVTEVKEAADYITDSNENDGAAKAIEKFALK